VKILCVENLSNLTTEGQLQGWFRAFGVSPQRIQIVRDGMSGQPLMLAFVTAADSYHASWAIACCDGQDFMGRRLTINVFSLPREHAV
jgi:hypothetical protein